MPKAMKIRLQDADGNMNGLIYERGNYRDITWAEYQYWMNHILPYGCWIYLKPSCIAALPTKWLLQTYFFWHELEERGFSREFDTKEAAEMYARNNACGSRHTITPLYPANF